MDKHTNVCAWAADPHFTHLHLPRAERLMSIGWSGARIKTQRASSLYVEWQGTEPKSSHLTPLRQGVLVRRATWLGSNSTRGFLRGLGSRFLFRKRINLVGKSELARVLTLHMSSFGFASTCTRCCTLILYASLSWVKIQQSIKEVFPNWGQITNPGDTSCGQREGASIPPAAPGWLHRIAMPGQSGCRCWTGQY